MRAVALPAEWNVALPAEWNVLPEGLMKMWRSRAMMKWRTMDGGVNNLITVVCLLFVRDFHRFIEDSGGEADEITFVGGFQEFQELLAAGWQQGRRGSGPRVSYIPGEYDLNAKNEVWLQTVVVSSMVL